MAFVYYWYKTYEEKGHTVYENLGAEKNKILAKSIMDFEQRKAAIVQKGNLTAKEASALIGCMTEDSAYTAQLRKLFEATFDSYNIPQESWKKKAATITTMAQADKIIAENSNAIQEAIDVFQQSLNDALDKMYKAIIKQGAVSDLISERIKGEMAGNKNLSEDMIIEKFFTDYLAKRKNGAYYLGKDANASMKELLATCSVIAEGIKVLGSKENASIASVKTGTQSLTDTTLPDCFVIIGGKLDGLMRNIKGLAGEMAVAEAFKKGDKDLKEALQKFERANLKKFLGGKTFNVKTSVMGEETVDAKWGNTKGNVRAKSDVNIIITGNGITVQFGASVKSYTIKGSEAAHTNVKLADSTTFDRALHYAAARSGYSYESLTQYIYNVGGGKIPSAGKRDHTESQLTENLKGVKEFVICGALLEMLAGTGLKTKNNKSDNVMFFVLNGKIFSIDQILRRVIQNSGMELAASSFRVKGLTRSSMKQHNAYIPKDNENAPKVSIGLFADEEKAKQRSNKAVSAYKKILQAKITITMSILNKLVM